MKWKEREESVALFCVRGEGGGLRWSYEGKRERVVKVWLSCVYDLNSTFGFGCVWAQCSYVNKGSSE